MGNSQAAGALEFPAEWSIEAVKGCVRSWECQFARGRDQWMSRRDCLTVFTDMSRADAGAVTSYPVEWFRRISEIGSGAAQCQDILLSFAVAGVGPPLDRAALFLAIAKTFDPAGPCKSRQWIDWWTKSDYTQKVSMSSLAVSNALARGCNVAYRVGWLVRPPTQSELASLLSMPSDGDGASAGMHRMSVTAEGIVRLFSSFTHGFEPPLYHSLDRTFYVLGPTVKMPLTNEQLRALEAAPSLELSEEKRPHVASFVLPPKLSSSQHGAHAHRSHLRRMRIDKATSHQALQHAADRSGFSLSTVRAIKAKFVAHADEFGLIGLRQFRDIMSSVFPKLVGDGTLDVLFQEFDHEKHGKCAFRELVHGLAMVAHGAPSDRVDLCFELLDADGNGSISISEFFRFVEDSAAKSFENALLAAERLSSFSPKRGDRIDMNELGELAFRDRCVLNGILATNPVIQLLGKERTEDPSDSVSILYQAMSRIRTSFREMMVRFPQLVTFQKFVKYTGKLLSRESRALASTPQAAQRRMSALSIRRMSKGGRRLSVVLTGEDSDATLTAWIMCPLGHCSLSNLSDLFFNSFFSALDKKAFAVVNDSWISSIHANVQELIETRPGCCSLFQLFAAMTAKAPTEHVYAFFRTLDPVGINSVLLSDVIQCVLRYGEQLQQLAPESGKLFRILDLNGDGEITREELMTAVADNPKLLDDLSQLLGIQDFRGLWEGGSDRAIQKAARADHASALSSLHSEFEPAATSGVTLSMESSKPRLAIPRRRSTLHWVRDAPPSRKGSRAQALTEAKELLKDLARSTRQLKLECLKLC
jgi:Ca2+-binding EF-hand superfamily protein